MLCRAGKAINLSDDHKPMDDVEKERIEKANGFVEDKRYLRAHVIARQEEAEGSVEYGDVCACVCKSMFVLSCAHDDTGVDQSRLTRHHLVWVWVWICVHS